MAQSKKKRDAERRSAAAKKAAELRKKQQAAERRRQGLLVGGGVLGVILLIAVVAVVYFVSQDSSDQQAAARQPATAVAGINKNYGFVKEKGDPKAHIVVYEDFQCPACRSFQETLGPTLDKLVDQGVASVEYRMIAFLDQASTTNYSTRSLNAAQCVLDESGDQAYLKMHELLYANQPAEGGAGLPDETLTSLAEEAGAPNASQCIADQQYEGWTIGATRSAAEDGVTQTPTLLLNGEEFDLTGVRTTAEFEAKVYQAAGMQPPAPAGTPGASN